MMASKCFVLVGMMLAFNMSEALTPVDESLVQRHRYSSYDPYYGGSNSGIGIFGAFIFAIISGGLCFLGVMYYNKWRR